MIKGIVMANFFTKTNKDMKYIFKKSTNLNKKEKRRKKRGVMALIGLLLVLVELVISGLFLFEIFKLICYRPCWKIRTTEKSRIFIGSI